MAAPIALREDFDALAFTGVGEEDAGREPKPAPFGGCRDLRRRLAPASGAHRRCRSADDPRLETSNYRDFGVMAGGGGLARCDGSADFAVSVFPAHDRAGFEA